MVGIDNDDEFGPAEDIDADGGNIDWKDTAKTLQNRVNELDDQLAAQKAYPYEEGDNLVLGPGVFATKDRSVINWDGVNYTPQKAFEAHPPLKSYKVGEYVQVLVSGDWRDGKVMGSERGASMLHVETEYGPVSVMAPLRIRKVVS